MQNKKSFVVVVVVVVVLVVVVVVAVVAVVVACVVVVVVVVVACVVVVDVVRAVETDIKLPLNKIHSSPSTVTLLHHKLSSLSGRNDHTLDDTRLYQLTTLQSPDATVCPVSPSAVEMGLYQP